MAGRDLLHPAAGGGDVQAFAWAKWLVGQGHEVVYVCQSHPSLPAEDVVDGVSVRRLGTGPALALRAARAFWRERTDVDLVYEDPIGGGRTPFLSPLYSRRPTIAVWHQVSSDLFRALHPAPVATTLSFVERVIARAYRACRFWAPSDESAEAIATQLSIPREHIAVVSPTVDPRSVRSDAELVREPTALFLGVFRPYKAADHLVRAIALVRRDVPNVRAVLAGRRMDAEYEARLRTLIDELGLRDCVDLRFDVTESEKWQLLERTRTLVLPSLLEGFGIVSIEANMIGVPVIASSGVPHAAVEDGVNGLRYDYADVTRLAHRLTSIMCDDALYERLSVGALAAAAQRSPTVVGERFDALVEATVAGAVVPSQLLTAERFVGESSS